MNADMAPGSYKMSASVHDNVRNEDAIGYVTVNVLAVEQIAFDNQVNIPLFGLPLILFPGIHAVAHRREHRPAVSRRLYQGQQQWY